MPTDDRAVAALRKWSVLLDSAFRVPGTRVTFGLDPILGLIPGIGDWTSPLFAALVLVHAARLRIPRVVQLRMLINAAIDFGIGIIPVVGDLFDFGWKANVRNLDLLERHARPGTVAGSGDWLFVLLVLVILFAVAAIPVLIGAWILSSVRLF
jgi:hypothetical protein